jgi:hypothetical protein
MKIKGNLKEEFFILYRLESAAAADPRLRNSGVILNYGFFSSRWWPVTEQFCTAT